MLANLFIARKTLDHGFSLFAKETVPLGTIVSFICPKCHTAPLKNVKNTEAIKNLAYSFVLGSKVVTPCSDNRFTNHSCTANVLFTRFKPGVVIAVQDIMEGEEVTCDYRAFGVMPEFNCFCNTENCMKNTIEIDLLGWWESRINVALKELKNVKQPLLESLTSVQNTLLKSKKS